jgi:hypothetical protein
MGFRRTKKQQQEGGRLVASRLFFESYKKSEKEKIMHNFLVFGRKKFKSVIRTGKITMTFLRLTARRRSGGYRVFLTRSSLAFLPAGSHATVVARLIIGMCLHNRYDITEQRSASTRKIATKYQPPTARRSSREH